MEGAYPGALSFCLPKPVLSAIVAPIMVNHMRHTRAHTANRRSHHALKTPMLAVCSNCGAMHKPHHMCLECGFYKGRQVMDLKAQKDKRDARMQAKKEAVRAQMSAVNAPAPEAPAVEEKK